ncbi:MAG: hypothetical protein JST27_04950 [Bacteroidetes bacterium]|nr:hypothetical protein [Bacteroidota bacterium]
MSRLEDLKRHLVRGRVYRRADLAQWSKSVDRHLDELLAAGILKKLSHGLYYYPKKSVFGEAPPDERELVKSFLKDERFLLTSPNAYNALGVGTTQLYNTRVVYNHKRHGDFRLGNRTFRFQVKPHFPSQPTTEFLLVDLVNNLDELAEDKEAILSNVLAKAVDFNPVKLRQSVRDYGNAKTRKLLMPVLKDATSTASNGRRLSA